MNAKFARELEIRRERIRSFAEKAGIPTIERPNFDRIGPVRVIHIVNYETEILWGNLRLEEFLELDDLKAAERITGRVKSIVDDWFDSFEFFLHFKDAYYRASGWFPNKIRRNGRGLRIDHVYAAYVADKVRSGTGVKGASFDHYSLSDFLVDFARYWRNPETDDDKFIRMSEPRGSDLRQAFFIPNLKEPLAEEKPILRVELVPNSDR